MGSFVKDCEQKWATQIRAVRVFFFFFWLIDARCRMIDAWLLLSRAAAELLWAAPAKGSVMVSSGQKAANEAIDHSGDKPTLCLPVLIMMSSIRGSEVEGVLTYVRSAGSWWKRAAAWLAEALGSYNWTTHLYPGNNFRFNVASRKYRKKW